jgi:uncharacterized membrane protein
LNAYLKALIAHRHWITINLCGRSLCICARCLGVVVGVLLLLITIPLFEFFIFYSLPVVYQLSICITFIAPATYDWVTQSWGLRASTNKLRISTGVLEGFGVALLSLATISTIYKIAFFLFIFGCILTTGISGKRFHE